MKRFIVFLSLIVFLTSTARAAQLIDQVLEARPVYFQKPERFEGGVTKPAVADVLMIKVHVTDVEPFAPHDNLSPRFMVGNTAAKIIRSPIFDSTAILVAPVPAAGEPLTVWVAPAGPISELTPEATKRYYAVTADRLAIPKIPVGTVTKTVPDLPTLRKNPGIVR